MQKMKLNIFWFRRDLRLEDNAGLFHALKNGLPVLPVFIFDRNILDGLEDKKDARVEFIHLEIRRLQAELEAFGSGIAVLFGKPEEVFIQLASQLEIHAVFTNHDFEPYAILRDEAVKNLLAEKNIAFHTFKDHVIFEKNEVVKDDGSPYLVFTPYRRKWEEVLFSKTEPVPGSNGKVEPLSFFLKPYPTADYFSNFVKITPEIRQLTAEIPSLNELGFVAVGAAFPPKFSTFKLVKNYADHRDFPAFESTTKLSVHYRFGTVSIRDKARKALKISASYLNELAWRDFFAMILHHFPQVVSEPFRPEFQQVEWRNDEEEFHRWCIGQTGYPLVDAGMRELNDTGFMHNRVRMVTASFLTKHLLVDWRWGEAYFAKKLLDYDLASNVGNWQWAAGCGVDAAPYFRIFNPDAQVERFDKDLEYVKKWVPELKTKEYVEPLVDHVFARERCLKVFRKALKDREKVTV